VTVKNIYIDIIAPNSTNLYSRNYVFNEWHPEKLLHTQPLLFLYLREKKKFHEEPNITICSQVSDTWTGRAFFYPICLLFKISLLGFHSFILIYSLILYVFEQIVILGSSWNFFFSDIQMFYFDKA
jgi:hypothetical protein